MSKLFSLLNFFFWMNYFNDNDYFGEYICVCASFACYQAYLLTNWWYNSCILTRKLIYFMCIYWNLCCSKVKRLHYFNLILFAFFPKLFGNFWRLSRMGTDEFAYYIYCIWLPFFRHHRRIEDSYYYEWNTNAKTFLICIYAKFII